MVSWFFLEPTWRSSITDYECCLRIVFFTWVEILRITKWHNDYNTSACALILQLLGTTWTNLVGRYLFKVNNKDARTKQKVERKKILHINVEFSFHTLRNHSFSTYTKFFEKLIFLTSWFANVRVRIRG